MSTSRDEKGRFKKGHSGNPAGGQKHGVRLTTCLMEIGNRKYKAEGLNVQQKRYLAQLVWQAAIEGRVEFADGSALNVNSIRDWFTIVQWLYDRIDGKPKENVLVTDNPDLDITIDEFNAAMSDLDEWRQNHKEEG